MRRIDLLCKLVAPIFISLIDGYSTSVAVWVVFGQNAVSVLVEYFAIKQVFEKVPELAKSKNQAEENEDSANLLGRPANGAPDMDPDMEIPQARLSLIRKALQSWKEYVQNPAFLASFSLSLLYLTVLSTGTQMATFLLTLGFSSIHVSFMRLAAVALELFATCVAPILTKKIGPVRSGLWFINEQLVCVAAAVALFMSLPGGTKAAGAALIAGVTISRIGLWGFDLCVQFLVQEVRFTLEFLILNVS
jgi:iron-regulated transporter 1